MFIRDEIKFYFVLVIFSILVDVEFFFFELYDILFFKVFNFFRSKCVGVVFGFWVEDFREGVVFFEFFFGDEVIVFNEDNGDKRVGISWCSELGDFFRSFFEVFGEVKCDSERRNVVGRGGNFGSNESIFLVYGCDLLRKGSYVVSCMVWI